MKVDTDGLCEVDKQTHQPTHRYHVMISNLFKIIYGFEARNTSYDFKLKRTPILVVYLNVGTGQNHWIPGSFQHRDNGH